jgi:hypothetical protein
MKWFYFLSMIAFALVISGYTWSQIQAADPRTVSRFTGLLLACGLCCVWPLIVGAGGWWLRKAFHEGWRPSLASKPKQEEL